MKAPTAKDILEQCKDEVARKHGFPHWWLLDFHKTSLSEEALRDEASLLAMERIAEMSWQAGWMGRINSTKLYEKFEDKSTYMNNLFPKT